MGKRHKRPIRRWGVYVALSLVMGAAGIVALWWLVFGGAALDAEAILAAYREDAAYGELTIHYPLDETLFPPEIVPPTFRWEDGQEDSDAWLVTIRFQGGQGRMSFPCLENRWTPSPQQWEVIKRRSLEKQAEVSVLGVNRRSQERILSAAKVSISTSGDEVGAPIFYREVNLPFIEAVKDPSRIRWRFGEISSEGQPPVVLESLPVCGNCHSFSADGAVLGMDVDYANDKGSYAIARVAEEMMLDRSKIISWSDYLKEDEEPTFGLLSQVSPDGRYVVSTVKDRSVFAARDDLTFSQLFFPIKGILVVYDRQTKRFGALPGADDKRFVQSNPAWSPDGKTIVFARSEAYRLDGLHSEEKVLLNEAECREFLREGKRFVFDLYRIPFNEGRGGKAEPLEGASHNGMSNYFAKYSPDGKWIVFCKAKSFMLLQPDSELYLIPAGGGKARRLRCNTPRMNSWHSWSPNGKWLVFSSKANSPYTQLFLAHIDEHGRSSPAVELAHFTSPDRAANIPEFVKADAGPIRKIRERFLDDYSYARSARECILQGDYDGAAQACRKALALNPKNADALCSLGIALGEQGDIEQAKAHLLKAIQHQPGHKHSHFNLGVLLSRQQQYREAETHLRRALEIDPEFYEAHLSLGVNLLDEARLAEAAKHLAEAARLGSNDPRAQYYLGLVLHKQDERAQAAVRYARAIYHQPDHLRALLGLASIRAMDASSELRDGPQAVELAMKACRLVNYQEPRALDVLAAAYAETGQFREAALTAQRAFGIAGASGREDLAGRIQKRLECYARQEPFRGSEPPE